MLSAERAARAPACLVNSRKFGFLPASLPPVRRERSPCCESPRCVSACLQTRAMPPKDELPKDELPRASWTRTFSANLVCRFN